MVIADRSVCDSFEEWYEKSRSIHHLLALEPEVGLQIRNKSAQSKTEMESLMSELSPHERLWINGGWKGFQTHLRSTQHNAAFTRDAVSPFTLWMLLKKPRTEVRIPLSWPNLLLFQNPCMVIHYTDQEHW